MVAGCSPPFLTNLIIFRFYAYFMVLNLVKKQEHALNLFHCKIGKFAALIQNETLFEKRIANSVKYAYNISHSQLPLRICEE